LRSHSRGRGSRVRMALAGAQAGATLPAQARYRLLRTLLPGLAIIGIFALPAAATGRPRPLTFVAGTSDYQPVVEQQSPNFFHAPCSGGAGDGCDPSTWVVNPLRSAPCAWDVDDHFVYSAGSGYVEAGTSASVSVCVVADANDNYGGDDHMLKASVWAPTPNLTVTLADDQGVSLTLAPVPDGNGYRWDACRVDHTAGPFHEIPGSNGGVGLLVWHTLTVTAPDRTVRSVSGTLRAPLVGTPSWFDARAAGCV